jgi:hypothetical protein
MKTATKKPQAATEPPTFAEIAARKMAGTIEKYRGLVQRAADGVQLTGEELGEALELLSYMWLPEYCWPRDVEAQRNYKAAAAADAEAAAAVPAAQARLREIVERMKSIEAELNSLRAEQHSLHHVAEMKRVEYMRRMNELETLHPHVFADVKTATGLRSEAKAKATGHRPDPATAEPVTMGGWGR